MGCIQQPQKGVPKSHALLKFWSTRQNFENPGVLKHARRRVMQVVEALMGQQRSLASQLMTVAREGDADDVLEFLRSL